MRASYVNGSGALHFVTTIDGEGDLEIQLDAPSGSTQVYQLKRGDSTIDVGPVVPWELENGVLYDLRATLRDTAGEKVDYTHRRVGFRTVRWLPTKNAPEGAEPWLLEVNGKTSFMAGVNWVPIRPDYADVTASDYRTRMDQYRRIGINTLRVWGGAAREHDVFYDLADEYGFAVWQELPLSSSGLDNLPPTDKEFAAEFAAIATEYSRTIGHHACIVIWGGGNELEDYDDDGASHPLTDAHPALAAARDALAHTDADRRFVATSPSGPTFGADPADRGRGIHHDVHGPWETNDTFEAWKAYWDGDDAILRSEVGVGGASAVDTLTRYGLVGATGTEQERQALFMLWSHSSAWWLRPFQDWNGTGTLEGWVEASQQRQAQFLAYAARATKRRFPEAGGFIVWLGHDAFPCAVSLSLLDADGHPKPVADALADVFLNEDLRS